MRDLLVVAVVVLLGAGKASGGSYQQIYAQQIPGAEGYSYIDPIIDTSGELAGFIFLDAGQRSVIVARFGDSVRTIQLNLVPTNSVNFLGAADTIHGYVLASTSTPELPSLIHIRIAGEWWDQLALYPSYYAPSEGYGWDTVLDCRLSLPMDNTGSEYGVLLEATIHYDGWLFTIGPEVWDMNTSILYTTDLAQQIVRISAQRMVVGDISGDTTVEYATTDHYFHSIYDDDWQQYWAYTDESEFFIVGPDTSTLYHRKFTNGSYSALLCGDFDPDRPDYEIVCQGVNPDLSGDHPAAVPHIACYNFSSGVPVELWYHASPSFVPTYQFQSGGVLVGGRRSRESAFLNFRNGLVTDSITIDRSLAATKYFETRAVQPSLNLVGRVHDTIIVYRFDEITDVNDHWSEPEVPGNFQLSQNYPNPFNDQTEISFELFRTGHVRLEIFNMLGQLVGTPVDKAFPPGRHRVSWVARDESGSALASGVYLYRLTVDGSTRTQKMTLLK